MEAVVSLEQRQSKREDLVLADRHLQSCANRQSVYTFQCSSACSRFKFTMSTAHLTLFQGNLPSLSFYFYFIWVISDIFAISPSSCLLFSTSSTPPVVSHLLFHVYRSSASTLPAVIKNARSYNNQNRTGNSVQ